MYTVYLGLHDKSSLDRDGTYSLPTIKMSVSKVVVVNWKNLLIILTKNSNFFNKKHAGYSSSTYLNDIALIYLSSNVTLNNFIQIGISLQILPFYLQTTKTFWFNNYLACLPTVTSSSYPGTNLNVYAAGWGTLSSGKIFCSISSSYSLKMFTD